METAFLSALIGLSAAAVMMAFALVVQAVSDRRRSAPSIATRNRPVAMALAILRLMGLAAVACVAIGGDAVPATAVTLISRSPPMPLGDAATHVWMLLLAGFLWLTVTGFFGYGSTRRSDWVGLVPFAVALAVREIFTLHSIQEIEIQFAQGPVGRHSVVYPLFQLFFLSLVNDVQWFTMHLNGILGAAAALPLYLFVRQRLECRAGAVVCALLFAAHPLIARFAPTDGPYSLLLFTWFGGLALLSAPRLDARGLFGGTFLIGIAATARMEGALFALASLVLLDWRRLFEAAARAPLVATLALTIVADLFALHMCALLPYHVSGPTGATGMFSTLHMLVDAAIWPMSYNDPLLNALIWLGAVAGLARRYRLGLVAYAAVFVVLFPVANSAYNVNALHRLIPACALQVIVAGIGLSAVASRIAAGRRWMVVLSGSLAATLVLFRHWDALTVPYAFNEEYGLVRSHLAPGGAPEQGCALLTLASLLRADAGIHDFSQIVPGMKTLDCARTDCAADLASGGCLYYVRSTACFHHHDGVPPNCVEGGGRTPDGRPTCRNEGCIAFEDSLRLDPVELRILDPGLTFADHARSFPHQAEIGLFRVRRRDDGSAP